MNNSSMDNMTMCHPTNVSASPLEISDYIECSYLLLFVVVGLPINMLTLIRLSRQYHITKSRILLLNLNLNISDLMILLFYALTKAIWIATYAWAAGEIMCKTVRFLQLLTFCLSSNVIVSIGFDRFWSLMAPLHVKATANKRCKQMICLSWLFAVLCSVPQFFVWQTINITDTNTGLEWSQCVTVFASAQWVLKLNNCTLQMDVLEAAKFTRLQRFESIYNIYHLIVTFWLPCILVVICYVIILKKVLKHFGDDSRVEIVSANGKTCDCSSGASNVVLENNAKITTRLLVHGKHSKNRSISSRQSQQRRRPSHEERRPSWTFLRKTNSSGSAASGRQNAHASNDNNLRRIAGQMRIRRTKYRTLKVTMLIVCAYIVCWAPYNFLAIWGLVDPVSYMPVSGVFHFLYGLIALNAVVNPLIYGRLTLVLYWRKKGKQNEKARRIFFVNALQERRFSNAARLAAD